MRYRVYIRTDGVEQLLYDTETASLETAISGPAMSLELNKAGSFEFTIYPTHPMYNSFQKMKTFVRIVQDENDEIFRGRVLQIEDTIDMERSIQCEGDLAYLIDSMQYPDKVDNSTEKKDLTTNNYAQRNSVVESQRDNMPAETITVAQVNLSAERSAHETLSAHFIRYLAVHNSQMDTDKQFGVGNVTIYDRNVEQDFTSTDYRDTKEAMEQDLLKYYGGFLMTRKSNGVVYLDWLEDPGDEAEQPIILGYNLIDMQQQANSANVFSRLIPVGDNQLTIESVNNNLNYIQNNIAYAKYGAIYKKETFTGVTSASELKRQGQAYMATNCQEEPLTFSIKAIDMHLLDGSIEAIKLGSFVTVVSEPHNVSVQLVVTAIEYDLQNPENNTYTIGDPYEPLSTKTTNEKRAAAAESSAASTKASRASGGVGNLEQAVNRHASSIIDQADKLYSLQADELNITARVITIEADLLEIHTRALIITTDSVKLTADEGNIGPLWIYADGGPNGEAAAMLSGSGHFQFYSDVVVGGEFECSKITCSPEDNGDGIFYDTINLGTAIVDFDTATSSGGTITIPYERANGLSGSITFSMADTAWYKNKVAVDSVSAARQGNVSQSGDTLSASYLVTAYNKDGEVIKSATQTISMTGSFPSASHGPLTVDYVHGGSQPHTGGVNMPIGKSSEYHRLSIKCNGEFVDYLDIHLV